MSIKLSGKFNLVNRSVKLESRWEESDDRRFARLTSWIATVDDRSWRKTESNSNWVWKTGAKKLKIRAKRVATYETSRSLKVLNSWFGSSWSRSHKNTGKQSWAYTEVETTALEEFIWEERIQRCNPRS